MTNWILILMKNRRKAKPIKSIPNTAALAADHASESKKIPRSLVLKNGQIRKKPAQKARSGLKLPPNHPRQPAVMSSRTMNPRRWPRPGKSRFPCHSHLGRIGRRDYHQKYGISPQTTKQRTSPFQVLSRFTQKTKKIIY